MPELPEVETTRQGLLKLIVGRKILSANIYQPRLRWLVPEHLLSTLDGQRVADISRRGKYLLIAFKNGTLVMHLGMSGSIRVVDTELPLKKHEHFDFHFCFSRYFCFF